MIELRGITKTFGNITALNNINISIEKGQILGFLGANGAGKTTAMDILCGCMGADSGSASIAGFDITDKPIDAKRRLGYLPDEPPLHNDMRVRDFIAYAGALRGVPAQSLGERVAATMHRLDLNEVGHRLIANLSKGFRQRVGLAQALVHNPDVLVLDEPTEGLDPNQIVQIRALIRSLRGEHTIILSSHILSEVQNICDEIVILDKGNIVARGTYNSLAAIMTGPKSYVLRVAERPDQLIAELNSLKSIQNVSLSSTSEGLIEFALLESDSSLDQIAQIVLAGGFGLRELNCQRNSLEDVFFQFTTHS